jgi:hypothetical protein
LYYDITNSISLFSSSPLCAPLHSLSCVGSEPSTASLIEQQVAEVMNGQLTSVSVQATLDGNPYTGTFGYTLAGPSPQADNGPHTYNDVVPGSYTLAYTVGGPSANYSVSPVPQQTLGFDPHTGVNNWNLTFTIAFSSTAASPPTVTTLTATAIPGGATITGSVNPNGNPATAWFEWGASSTLVSPNTTPVQSAGSGTGSVTISFDLTGLVPNTPYYYRIAASSGGSTTVRGTILSFGTQGNLPAPTLLTPGDGARNVPYPPSLSWSEVAGATSYRLILATNPGALPTNATAGTCGTGCILNVTPVGTSYTPPAGALAPNTTYYWEVDARSADQFGNWSAIFSFTTAGNAGPAPSYVISAVAGNGVYGFSGDGGPATSAQLSSPYGVAVDAAGNLYIGDMFNNRIRRVTPSGTITTVAGNGTDQGLSGDGGPATFALLPWPWCVALDAAGNLYICSPTMSGIRRVTPSGTITTVAGNGTWGFSGDGGPATSAQLNDPQGLAVDAAGNLYIADESNQRIRRVTQSGTITTVAGNGTQRFSGDGGPATSAQLSWPYGLAVDAARNLYISGSERIRRVTPSGTITTVAGNGTQGFSGDGGPATSAQLYASRGVAVDAAGNLYIADHGNQRIRRVTQSGTITTVAGNGTPGFSGDGGPATSAQVWYPQDVAVDPAGNLYITENGISRIRILQPATSQSALSIAGAHSGNFAPGQTGATYSVVASNGTALGPTIGPVTVTETVPFGLTLLSMAGTGWTCYGGSCTRSDALDPGASYPAITVMVYVATDAPATVTNQVNVSGGGSATANASDITTITGVLHEPNWVQKNPANIPPARTSPAMAYDAARGQVVLFGGVSDVELSDTWVWDGTSWAQKNPLNSPTARYGHKMAYDAARGQVVLFGGRSGVIDFTDTWVWDGTNWTQKNPLNSPTTRNLHEMAYDAARGQVVLFAVRYGDRRLSDTWVWDGTNWTQKSPLNSPIARFLHAMAYDAARGQVVLFGGEDMVNHPRDTWVWDGTNWTQKNPLTSPTSIEQHQMAYDAARRQVVLFGGVSDVELSDIWVWPGDGGGCAFTLSSPDINISSAAFTGYLTVTASSSNCSWTAAATSTGWLQITSGGSGTTTGQIGYSTSANTTAAIRTGTITVGGKAFTVTQAAVDRVPKIGVYSGGRWQLDTGGNGVFDPEADKSFNWGWAETTPVYGDWNGDGKDEAGFFINGLWYLDYNGNGVWDGDATDKMYAFGMAGVEPKVGDWNGDGKEEIGIYIDGFWFLDMNGNGAWDGEPTDKMIIWGFVGSTPVTGDWNGDGRTKVGLYKDGLWYLDVDGNGIWDGGTTDKMIAWGWTGTTPVHGDWNGDGKEEVGVYLNGFWYLDMDGNGIWDGGTTDKMIILGWSGTLPVVGDWNGDGKTKVGTYINGYWYLDYNGNGVWDGESTDKAYLFGQAGDMPLVGRW